MGRALLQTRVARLLRAGPPRFPIVQFSPGESPSEPSWRAVAEIHSAAASPASSSVAASSATSGAASITSPQQPTSR